MTAKNQVKEQQPKFRIESEFHYDNPQFYQGHGHSFESDKLVACYEFSVLGDGSETVKEIAESILGDLNEAYYMNQAEKDEQLQEAITKIPDKDILNMLIADIQAHCGCESKRTNYKPYLDTYQENQKNCTEEELEENDNSYMGAIHIYLEKP